MFFPLIIIYCVLGSTVLLFYMLWCKFTSRRNRVSLFHLSLFLGPIGWAFIILVLILFVPFVIIRDIRMQKKLVLGCEPTTTVDSQIQEMTMNHEDAKTASFQWMEHAVEKGIIVPIETILKSSFYYPSAGFDGDAIRCFSHLTQSFVYVDYGIKPGALDQNLEKHPFSGYHIALRVDGDLHSLYGIEHGEERVLPSKDRSKYHFSPKPHFAIHMIFKREARRMDDHGPEYFSLLYIGGEGVASYQALYLRTGIVPKVIGIIQPGHGFGGNWTNYCDPEGPFAKNVFSHPEGMPDYIVHGGWGRPECYRKPIWASYNNEKTISRSSENPMALWARNKTGSH